MMAYRVRWACKGAAARATFNWPSTWSFASSHVVALPSYSRLLFSTIIAGLSPVPLSEETMMLHLRPLVGDGCACASIAKSSRNERRRVLTQSVSMMVSSESGVALA
jgi:hypothetical protein